VGGDELFAGYPWRYLDILNTDSNSFLHGYFDRNMRFLTDSQKKNLFSLEVNDELEGFRAFDSYADVLKGHSDDDPLHKAMYFDFKTFLNGLLTVDDKLSMAASLEVRVPFLDNDLVDYVRRIPSEYLLDGETGKAVLRKAMAKQLPENTIRRRKQGFTPPDCSWYKGENLSYVKDLILSDRSLQRGYFNPDYLRKVINNHLSNQYDNRFFIWSLMGFEWWNRLFIDGDPLPEASF
jgi:asparagine synthase (glutamine-hydrolysing)